MSVPTIRCGLCGCPTASKRAICWSCRRLETLPPPTYADALTGGRWVHRRGIKVWESRCFDSDSSNSVRAARGDLWDTGTTNQNGPRPAALTAGSSRGLADEALRSVD